GVTPPHVYELTQREALFHGVPALRLNPVGGEETIYGRSGLLAHTYMLGPNGDSNGCVSFRDYNAFLNAYRSQGIRKLAVVARIEGGRTKAPRRWHAGFEIRKPNSATGHSDQPGRDRFAETVIGRAIDAPSRPA